MKPNDPKITELFKHAVAYGKAICGIKERKWYNPMRWIRGKYYEDVISPLKFYKPVSHSNRPVTGFGSVDKNGHIPNGFDI